MFECSNFVNIYITIVNKRACKYSLTHILKSISDINFNSTMKNPFRFSLSHSQLSWWMRGVAPSRQPSLHQHNALPLTQSNSNLMCYVQFRCPTKSTVCIRHFGKDFNHAILMMWIRVMRSEQGTSVNGSINIYYEFFSFAHTFSIQAFKAWNVFVCLHADAPFICTENGVFIFWLTQPIFSAK